MRNLVLKVLFKFQVKLQKKAYNFPPSHLLSKKFQRGWLFYSTTGSIWCFLCFMHNLWISPSSSIQLKRSFTSSWNLEITFIKGGLKSWGTKNTNLPILYFFLYVLYLLSSTHCVGIVVFTRRLQAKTSRRKNSLYLFLNLSIWNKIQDK